MYNKILVPLDGSQLAECALGHVRAIATGCGVAEIVLLTVIEEYTFGGIQEGANQQQVQQMIKEMDNLREGAKQKAQQYLAKVSEDLKQSGLTVQTEIMIGRTVQHPADVILNYADNNQVDLIVITTHGRSGITRWAFGSEADKIVTRSKIPVLTITPTGCRI